MKSRIQYFIIVMSLYSAIYPSDSDDETVIMPYQGVTEYQVVTQLIHAISNGDLRSARQLLEDGVNPDVKDEYNFYPLHYAAYNHNLAMINLLLEFNADPNVFDEYNNSPLHAIADSRCIACAQALLDAGADRNAMTDDNRRPVDLAHIPAMINVLNP